MTYAPPSYTPARSFAAAKASSCRTCFFSGLNWATLMRYSCFKHLQARRAEAGSTALLHSVPHHCCTPNIKICCHTSCLYDGKSAKGMRPGHPLHPHEHHIFSNQEDASHCGTLFVLLRATRGARQVVPGAPFVASGRHTSKAYFIHPHPHPHLHPHPHPHSHSPV